MHYFFSFWFVVQLEMSTAVAVGGRNSTAMADVKNKCQSLKAMKKKNRDTRRSMAKEETRPVGCAEYSSASGARLLWASVTKDLQRYYIRSFSHFFLSPPYIDVKSCESAELSYPTFSPNFREERIKKLPVIIMLSGPRLEPY